MARVGIDPLAILQQVDRGPFGIVVELLPLPHRHAVRILDVGHHLGRLGGNQRLEFGANVSGRLFERGDAGEMLAVMEFGFRHARIMKIGRFLMVMARPPRPGW